MATNTRYYVPESSYWPIMGSFALFFMAFGGGHLIHGDSFGMAFFFIGALILAFMMFGWFRNVIYENRHGLHSDLMDRSYRWGMLWFIFSEIMFFAAFFGALFYVRIFSVPWLGGLGEGAETHALLWPNFTADWPLYNTPDPEAFVGPNHILGAWGIPAINTVLLLTSAVTLTIAHWALKANKRGLMILGLVLTILLGIIFLSCQAYEYWMALTHDGLTLNSGIYGSTFFMLTGFHGAHVTIGAIMLTVILLRCLKGHFDPENHFGFEAVAWYWHFVDYVWLTLFVFVYWI